MVGPVGPPAHCESKTQFRYEESSRLWSLQANIEEKRSLEKKKKKESFPVLKEFMVNILNLCLSVTKIDSSKKEDQSQNFLCYL